MPVPAGCTWLGRMRLRGERGFYAVRCILLFIREGILRESVVWDVTLKYAEIQKQFND